MTVLRSNSLEGWYRSKGSNLKVYWPLCPNPNPPSSNHFPALVSSAHADMTHVGINYGITAHPTFLERGPYIDTSGRYISCTSSTLMSAIGTPAVVSVCAWYYFNSSDSGNIRYVFDGVGNISSNVLGLYANASNNLIFEARPSTGEAMETATAGAVSHDGWHFFAGVADFPNDVIKTSIDGAALADTVVTFTGTAFAPGSPTTKSGLVCSERNSGYNMTGSALHIAIFDVALTDTDVTNFYGAAYGRDKVIVVNDVTEGTNTLSLTLRDTAGNLKSNLTGLYWTFYMGTPAEIAAGLPASASGSGASTNASGVFSVTSITGPGVAAGNGYIVITDSDGNPSNNSLVAALPVTLT